ncbi:DUF6368 family protein [Chitinimonas viridis]|uniref:DUF6368 family protein n=1 Tax=Chitinimonas viridis TaxID=664880 RepID=A0ABT8B8F5_9NEIS|nr:DUF6368 family protein [Chitinimonas viridis]MDN3577784.1 DUF6368 family protein [Chitinimonas viridis]
MSCYAVTILTPMAFSPEEIERATNVLASLAEPLVDGDFWISGQSFCFQFTEPDEDERDIVISGWAPRGALQIASRSGSKISHFIIGVLSSRLARMFDGWIELGGPLTLATSNPSILTYDGVLGRIQTAYGVDVISPSVMDYWLGSDEFRLI